MDIDEQNKYIKISVPIRGLFNLTFYRDDTVNVLNNKEYFRPHQGII